MEPTYVDPENHQQLIARTEVERRQQYIEQFEDKFPQFFVRLMKRCLHNHLSERPTAEELVTSLEEMKADIEGPYGDVARIDAVRQVVMMRALRKRDTEVRRKDVEICQLQQELEHERVSVSTD